jgi:hypothetical protein
LFSPVSALKEHELEKLQKLSETTAALRAVTLNVKPLNEIDSTRSTVQFDVFLDTPVEPSVEQIKREEEVSDIIDKWTK